MSLNETHDPQLESWLDASNHPDCEFPIQNLPFGVFTKTPDDPRSGVALGDQIIDVARLADLGLVQDKASVAARCCANPTLNALMSLGRPYWNALRCELSTLFSRASEAKREQMRECLVPMSAVQMQLPASIGDYSDFYTSIYHARNVGLLFRPDNPLLDNYYHLPIAYHGRSSSVIVSGEDVQRPIGQIRAGGEQGVTVSRSTKLDYEFELGAFIGPGNERGRPLALANAEEHVFGLCLLNDWSARDIQAFEYQPLGPFLGKSFATTISPWIVTLDALAPFRGPWQVGDSRFPLADYLRASRNEQKGAFHIELEAYLHTETMRTQNEAPSRLSATNFRHAYWTIGQMVAHHTINGCNLRAGDLLGTGTQSGPSAAEAGALIELTQGASRPIALANGEERGYLSDGDEVIFRARCLADSARTIGFGECRGRISPARDLLE